MFDCFKQKNSLGSRTAEPTRDTDGRTTVSPTQLKQPCHRVSTAKIFNPVVLYQRSDQELLTNVCSNTLSTACLVCPAARDMRLHSTCRCDCAENELHQRRKGVIVCSQKKSTKRQKPASSQRHRDPLDNQSTVKRQRRSQSTHSESESKEKRFVCPLCPIACTNQGQLRGHLRIHTGERPFVCPFPGCSGNFTRNEELTRHKRIHTGDRPFCCQQCGKRFGRRDHMRKHERTHLVVENKESFVCNECGKRYSRSDALRRHVASCNHKRRTADRPAEEN